MITFLFETLGIFLILASVIPLVVSAGIGWKIITKLEELDDLLSTMILLFVLLVISSLSIKFGIMILF